jgi:hypothetical protein
MVNQQTPVTWQLGGRGLAATLIVLALSAGISVAQQGSEALLAEVAELLTSLGQAYQSGDRAALRKHFEHGDLLPDDDRNLRMLGRLNLWDKPIEKIETEGATIAVTIVLDPESDLPAQRRC